MLPVVLFLVSSLMQVQSPSLFSRHKLVLLSPPETPKTLPVSDQLTFHTTSSNVFRMVGVHEVISSEFHIITRRSCEQLAIWERGKPMLGAQATSLTQSEWTSSRLSSTHRSPSSFQILTLLSQPPDTKRFIWVPGLLEVFLLALWSNAGSGTVDGHQLTALHPIVCALEIFLYSQVAYSTLQVRMEMDPSELPQATIRPYSAGAKATLLTEESWLLYSYHLLNSPLFSFHRISLRS